VRYGKRVLTRGQALAWCDEWSDQDRLIVGAALDAAVGVDCWASPSLQSGPYVYTPASDGYLAVKVWDWQYDWENFHEGYRPGWIRPVIVERSRILWPLGRKRYTQGVWDNPLFDVREGEITVGAYTGYCLWVPLSPYRQTRAGRAERAAHAEEVCPSCWMVLPKTGVCDNCGGAG